MTTIKEIQKIQDERFEKWYEGLANPPSTSVVMKYLQERDQAIIEGVKDDVLQKGYEIIKWNKDPQNQWGGLLQANTTINAIQQLLDQIREPKNVGN